MKIKPVTLFLAVVLVAAIGVASFFFDVQTTDQTTETNSQEALKIAEEVGTSDTDLDRDETETSTTSSNKNTEPENEKNLPVAETELQDLEYFVLTDGYKPGIDFLQAEGSYTKSILVDAVNPALTDENTLLESEDRIRVLLFAVDDTYYFRESTRDETHLYDALFELRLEDKEYTLLGSLPRTHLAFSNGSQLMALDGMNIQKRGFSQFGSSYSEYEVLADGETFFSSCNPICEASLQASGDVGIIYQVFTEQEIGQNTQLRTDMFFFNRNRPVPYTVYSFDVAEEGIDWVTDVSLMATVEGTKKVEIASIRALLLAQATDLFPDGVAGDLFFFMNKLNYSKLTTGLTSMSVYFEVDGQCYHRTLEVETRRFSGGGTCVIE